MIRAALLLVLLGVTAVWLGRVTATEAIWVAVVAVGFVIVSGRRWPRPPVPAPPLIGSGALHGRSPRLLRGIELEVAAAVDPRLGGDARLQRRLTELARHRLALPGDVPEEAVREAAGGFAAGMMTVNELEELVARIEAL